MEIEIFINFCFPGIWWQIRGNSDYFAPEIFYFRVNFLQLNQRIIAVASPDPPIEIEDDRSFFAQMFQANHLAIGACEFKVGCFLPRQIRFFKDLPGRFVINIPVHKFDLDPDSGGINVSDPRSGVYQLSGDSTLESFKDTEKAEGLLN